MNIINPTPILYDRNNSFNHLLKDILEEYCKNNHTITRLVAYDRKSSDSDYTLGIMSRNIKYMKRKRKKNKKSNIMIRFITDNLMNIRMAFCILYQKNMEVLLEDASYASIWTVLAAKIKKLKILLMVQDIWPDNAVQSGLLKRGSFSYCFFKFCQKQVYYLSDKIICISEDMKEVIQRESIDFSKISVIYNWGYNDAIVDISWEQNVFVKKHNLVQDKFYVVYAGNIGRMQNVNILLQTACQLREFTWIHFLIVGEGVCKEELVKQAEELELHNVTFLPMESSEIATHIYSMAGVNIVPLVKGGIRTAMPSKISVCMSCGRPIILCADKDSKTAMMIQETNTGLIVEPNDYLKLADYILSIAYENITFDRQVIWSFYENWFRREKNIARYTEELNKLIN